MINKILTKKIYSIIILVLLAFVSNLNVTMGSFSSSNSTKLNTINGTSSNLLDLPYGNENNNNISLLANKTNNLNNTFYSNKGQVNDTEILYYYSSPNIFVGFLKNQIIYSVRLGPNQQFESFNVSFISTTKTYPSGVGSIGSVINIFDNIGSYKGIHGYSSIYYYNIYPNINLRFYFTDLGLKYEFISLSGNVNQIKIKLSPNVKLDLSTESVSLKMNNKNILFDSGLKVMNQGTDRILTSQFIQYDTWTYGFKINETAELSKNIIIDPLLFSEVIIYPAPSLTYTGIQEGNIIRVDSNKNVYVLGSTNSAKFTVKNALDPTFNNDTDVVLLKYDSDFNLLYSTFIGGEKDDFPSSMILDSEGNPYISGTTDSINFPANNTISINNSLNKGDIFFLKISSDGQKIIFSTIYGGDGPELNSQIVIDHNNNIFIGGYTNSSNLVSPNTNFSLIPINHSLDIENYFLAKFSPDGKKLLNSTLLQRGYRSYPIPMAVDSNNDLVVIGAIYEQVNVTPDAYDKTFNHYLNVFIMKIDVVNFKIIFDTYLGGNTEELANAVAIGKNNNIYITGYTRSRDFPVTPNAWDITYHKGKDVFVSILSANGSKLLYSTFLGGTQNDEGTSIAVTSKGEVFITGNTESISEFPVTDNAMIILHKGGTMIFITKLSPDLSKIYYSSLFGGEEFDEANSLALSGDTNYYITGKTTSQYFPSFYRINSSIIGSKIFFSAFYDMPKDDLKYALSRTTTHPDVIANFLINNFFSGLLVIIVLIYIISFIKKHQQKSE